MTDRNPKHLLVLAFSVASTKQIRRTSQNCQDSAGLLTTFEMMLSVLIPQHLLVLVAYHDWHMANVVAWEKNKLSSNICFLPCCKCFWMPPACASATFHILKHIAYAGSRQCSIRVKWEPGWVFDFNPQHMLVLVCANKTSTRHMQGVWSRLENRLLTINICGCWKKEVNFSFPLLSFTRV